MGQIASTFASTRSLPIIIEVRINGWVAYRASHEGSNQANDSWLIRKNRVVELTHHSTMYERVRLEELGLDWYEENGLSEELYAIHGGGFPILTRADGLSGVLLISGLPQIEDHELALETLQAFKEHEES